MEVCDQCGQETMSKAMHWALECPKIHGETGQKVMDSITELSAEQKIRSTIGTIKNLDPDESCVEVTWADDPTPQYLDIKSLKTIVEGYENAQTIKN